MAYGVKVGIKAKDIYDRLTLAEKERFEEKNGPGTFDNKSWRGFQASYMCKHNYDENKYKELVKKESWAMQNIGEMSSCPKRSL